MLEISNFLRVIAKEKVDIVIFGPVL